MDKSIVSEKHKEKEKEKGKEKESKTGRSKALLKALSSMDSEGAQRSGVSTQKQSPNIMDQLTIQSSQMGTSRNGKHGTTNNNAKQGEGISEPPKRTLEHTLLYCIPVEFGQYLSRFFDFLQGIPVKQGGPLRIGINCIDMGELFERYFFSIHCKNIISG